LSKNSYIPESVNIELTLACNLRCLHCGSGAGKARKKELEFGEFKNLFKGLQKLGCKEVCLLGGEPFLRKDWYEIGASARDCGMEIVFITNGWTINRKIIDGLKRLGKISRIGVSLDGASPEIHDKIRGRKGSFERAWKSALMLRDAGFETGVITTLSKLNFSQIEPMKDLLFGMNITWQLQVASPHGLRFNKELVLDRLEFYEAGKKISHYRNTIPANDLPVCGSHDFGYFSSFLTRYGELPEWHGCSAGIHTLGIMSDGSVKGCLCQHDDFIEDNIRKRNIEEIWNDEKLFSRNRKFRYSMLEGTCKGCKYGNECRAGCSNLSYTITGLIYDNPYCFHAIERDILNFNKTNKK